jgi:hypothetical protein
MGKFLEVVGFLFFDFGEDICNFSHHHRIVKILFGKGNQQERGTTKKKILEAQEPPLTYSAS